MLKRLSEFVTDDSGKLSMGRALVALVVVPYVLYAGCVVYHAHTLPDIPYGVAALVGVLYAANKFSPTYAFPAKPEEGEVGK